MALGIMDRLKSQSGGRGANLVLAHAGCNNKRAKRRFAHDPVYGSGGREAEGDGLLNR